MISACLRRINVRKDSLYAHEYVPNQVARVASHAAEDSIECNTRAPAQGPQGKTNAVWTDDVCGDLSMVSRGSLSRAYRPNASLQVDKK